MHKVVAVPILFCLMLVLAGCTTTLADARAGKGTGISKVYDKSYEVVWNAVTASVVASGLKTAVVSKEEGLILAQGSVSAFTMGENVAVFVEMLDGDTKTRVEVVNKAVVTTNITARDWAPRIFNHLDARL